MLRKIISYLSSAIRSNTGVSSLSMVVVFTGIMAIVILAVVCVCMLIEVITSKTITSSLDGYAAIITAVAGLVAAVGIPKAITNYSERKYSSEDNNDKVF